MRSQAALTPILSRPVTAQRARLYLRCFLTGTGGEIPPEGDPLGLDWDPYKGSQVLDTLANPPYQYQIAMYVAPRLASAYDAALHNCAAFDFF